MNITIETYRGIEIWFNTDKETFQCDIDDEKSIKKSYSAIKKFIDDYKKENQNFKPFRVTRNPNSYGGKDGLIVGIRKDNRFILETEEGKKEQVSEYNETNFMLKNSNNSDLLLKLKSLKEELYAYDKKNREE